MKSGQDCTCHQDETGAVLLSTTPPNPMIADSGCNQTILPPTYRPYVVKQLTKRGTKVMLGGKEQEILGGPKCLIHMPVEDLQGRKKIMAERATISKDARYPLLACMHKPLKLSTQGKSVKVHDKKGNMF